MVSRGRGKEEEEAAAAGWEAEKEGEIDYIRVQGGGGGGRGGGEDAAAGAVRQGRVLPRLQVHHRRRVPDPHPHPPPQARQGPDLGHRRPGEVPGRDERLLPWRAGRHGGVRRDPAVDVRPRAPLGGGAPCPRRRLHRGLPRRQQGGPRAGAPAARGDRRRGRAAGRGAGSLLLRGVGADGGQRGARLPGAPRGGLCRRLPPGARARRGAADALRWRRWRRWWRGAVAEGDQGGRGRPHHGDQRHEEEPLLAVRLLVTND